VRRTYVGEALVAHVETPAQDGRFKSRVHGRRGISTTLKIPPASQATGIAAVVSPHECRSRAFGRVIAFIDNIGSMGAGGMSVRSN
jgi:hypothetical protein